MSQSEDIFEKKRGIRARYILLCACVTTAVVGTLYCYLWFSWALNSPLTKVPLRLEVRKGETLNNVLEQLPQQAVSMRRLPITVYARAKGIERKIHYGRYRIPAYASARQFLDMLQKGKALLSKVTVLPGSTVKAVAEALEKAEVLKGERFISFAKNPARAREIRQRVFGYEAGGGDLEGYLFPDTYYFSPGSPPYTVAFVMVENLARHLPSDWQERANRLGLSLHQVLTLASIVEKETYLKREMPIIASVFLRRLKLGMKLQADPTVIYAVEKEKGSRPRRLRWRDLRIESPYNTYQVTGLPPGPICNPSGDAIYAVLHPAKTNYLYFVAKGGGGHKFSATLREHINAVNRYQRRR